MWVTDAEAESISQPSSSRPASSGCAANGVVTQIAGAPSVEIRPCAFETCRPSTGSSMSAYGCQQPGPASRESQSAKSVGDASGMASVTGSSTLPSGTPKGPHARDVTMSRAVAIPPMLSWSVHCSGNSPASSGTLPT